MGANIIEKKTHKLAFLQLIRPIFAGLGDFCLPPPPPPAHTFYARVGFEPRALNGESKRDNSLTQVLCNVVFQYF